MSEATFSVLDLSPITQGASPRDAFHHSLDLAQHAERWGFKRYWLAEHHNMSGIASAATSVLIGYIAGGTQHIRVGSGGIMLPNHSPLVIAEQFGTLESLYPGRIDLGLGRAPGTDAQTMAALRRDIRNDSDNFPHDVAELQRYFGDIQPQQAVKAVPGQGLHVPLWLLGSSLYSAQLAARMGLPFAFASHFAPDMLYSALDMYRRHFQPSGVLSQPYALVCINVIAAESDEKARVLLSSLQQQFINLRRGMPKPLPPPVDNIHAYCSAAERYSLEQALRMSVIGDKEQVRCGLQDIINATGADEIMVNGQIFDHQARLRSFEIVADVMLSLMDNTQSR